MQYIKFNKIYNNIKYIKIYLKLFFVKNTNGLFNKI